MKTISILTPSFLPDIDSFARLHRSVVEFTNDGTIHHAIVPHRDLEAFRRIGSSRLRVWSEQEFLPKGFVATDNLAALRRRIPLLPQSLNISAVNMQRPWPPIRGWVLQQILKLSAATSLHSNGIIVIDSDVVLVRPMPDEIFFQGDVVRSYEQPEGISHLLPRHLLWTRTAYALLGIPWMDEATFPDYVGGIVSWDPNVVAACLERVATVSGTNWATAITKNLHFSEFVLYGTYLRHFGSDAQRSFMASNTLCHSYWASASLSSDEAQDFAASISEKDVALHIQSNSRTAPGIVENAVAALAKKEKQ